MASSNNERVGKGLEALKRGLGPYVLREMKRHYGDRLETQLEKVLYKPQLDSFRQRGSTDKAFLEAVDVDVLLKIMRLNYREVFFDKLGHKAGNYVHEATSVRNDWAHQKSFSTESAARALETLMLLLREVGANQEAEEVGGHLHAVRNGDQVGRNKRDDRGNRHEHGDRYEMVRPLGSGGMGEVYLARDKRLDRDVAIKYLSIQYAKDLAFVQRFDREAKSAASLSHPNIVSVYDRGQTEDKHYIVMEYVPGETLKDCLRREGPVPAKTAAEVASQITAALDAAHSRGVIHRDIKPQNILVTEAGGVKVADFGIARAASHATITHAGQILGTPHYISPEQAGGEPAGPRSDLYSLGVVLYEMLTGEPPYDADTPTAVMMKHMNSQLRPPREMNPKIPENINALTVKLLSKSPEERHQSAAELLDDLEKIVHVKDSVATGTKPRHDRKREETDHTEPTLAEIVVSPDSGEGFTTIGQAFREIRPGGKIRVRPGVYQESLFIDKPVEIIGERGVDGDAVIESTVAPCLSITASRGIVKGLILRRLAEPPTGRHPHAKNAVTISAGQVTIEECSITSARWKSHCVLVDGSNANPTIRNCKMHDAHLSGISFRGDSKGLVENCDILGKFDSGVEIISSSPIIRNCDIYSLNGAGVEIDANSNPTIQSCNIGEGETSTVVVGTKIHTYGYDSEIKVLMEDCTITRNQHYAVWAVGSKTVVILKNCNLENNARGLRKISAFNPWKTWDGARVHRVSTRHG